jgi:HAD superfamily hydrolase (TIGR01509 family)
VSDRWIVFDLIGVLAEPSWREIATASGDAWRSYKLGERAEAAFWDAAHAAAYRNAMSFRGDRLAYVRSLKARGYRICLASNFSREWLLTLLAKGGAGLFDAEVVSAEVGVAKPDPAFYHEVLRRAPLGSIFVDDQRANCAAAKLAGLQAIFAYPGCPVEAEIERLLTNR